MHEVDGFAEEGEGEAVCYEARDFFLDNNWLSAQFLPEIDCPRDNVWFRNRRRDDFKQRHDVGWVVGVDD